MRKLLNKALVALKQVQYLHTNKSVPRKSLIENVPYFSQWESPELVEAILTHKMDATDDPHWKASGAKTKEEYASWSANACGLACTKMILAKELGSVIPIVELAKKSVNYGVYTMPLETSVGLIYKPYVKFMKSEFTINATLVLPLTLGQIIYELSRGNYVIASVSPMIRNVHATPPSKGGHLVLVLGYDLDKMELYLHNPSGFVKTTQEYASVSFKDFGKFFGGRGIVVKSLKLSH